MPTNVGVPNNDPKTPRITVEKLDVLKTGEATVRVHVSQAKRRLRPLLEENDA